MVSVLSVDGDTAVLDPGGDVAVLDAVLDPEAVVLDPDAAVLDPQQAMEYPEHQSGGCLRYLWSVWTENTAWRSSEIRLEAGTSMDLASSRSVWELTSLKTACVVVWVF